MDVLVDAPDDPSRYSSPSFDMLLVSSVFQSSCRDLGCPNVSLQTLKTRIFQDRQCRRPFTLQSCLNSSDGPRQYVRRGHATNMLHSPTKSSNHSESAVPGKIPRNLTAIVHSNLRHGTVHISMVSSEVVHS